MDGDQFASFLFFLFLMCVSNAQCTSDRETLKDSIFEYFYAFPTFCRWRQHNCISEGFTENYGNLSFFFFSIFLWMEDLIEFEKRIENHCNVHYSSSVTRSQFDNRNYHLLLFPRRIRLEDTQPIRQTFFSVYRIVQVSSSRTQTQI